MFRTIQFEMNSNDNPNNPSQSKKEGETSQFLQGVNSYENRFTGMDGQIAAAD
jgi:hypothetical protein